MKTKNILSVAIVTLLLSFFATPAVAQIKAGVKGGIELESTNSDDLFNVEDLTSYYVGPSVEVMFPLGLNIGFDVSLFYSDSRMNLQGGTNTASNRHLMLPVNFKLRVPVLGPVLRLYGTAGPYVGYLISDDELNLADFGSKLTGIGSDIKGVGSDISGIGSDIRAKKFAAGLNVGAGLELFTFIHVGVNYRIKLTDDYSSSNKDWMEALNDNKGVLSVTAALLF